MADGGHWYLRRAVHWLRGWAPPSEAPQKHACKNVYAKSIPCRSVEDVLVLYFVVWTHVVPKVIMPTLLLELYLI